MLTASRIRHSFVGRAVRKTIHAYYSRKHQNGEPVSLRLPGNIDIQLFPEGEIAEFLAVQWLFEKTEMALAANYLRPGMTVIDVGANIGLYSVLAQKQVGEKGRVWAFEPSSESYQRLLKNILLNGCNQVRPVQVALSDSSDCLVLKSDPGFGDAYRYLSPSANSSGGEVVPVMPLDLFASQNEILRADYMKVDVEGGEHRVFAGSREFLASSPNILVMFENEPEWCARAGCNQEDTFALFTDLGFGLFAWDKRGRKWIDDEASVLASSTVWASRDPKALPVL